jgi:hypothetical protein
MAITIDADKVGNVVDWLADILAEFGHKEQILLSTHRLQEMYDTLNSAVTECDRCKDSVDIFNICPDCEATLAADSFNAAFE